MKNKPKPFTLLVKETEEELVKIINSSNIPAFCLKQILSNLYNQLNELENQEIKDYQEKERKEKENEKTDKKK